MTDKLDTKIVLPVALTLCASMMLLMGLIPNLIVLSVTRFLSGACGAFGFVGCMKVATNIFEKKDLSKAAGIIATLGMLGGFMTQTPLVHLIQKTSWQTGLVVTACIGYGISLAIFFALKKVPFSHHPISKNTKILSELKSVFINTQNIFCALYTSLMNLPIYMLGAMWGIPYLLHVGHYSETQAASICGMLFLGVMIGSPLTGIIADLKRSRRMMMILGAFLSIVIMLAILSDYTSYYIDLSLFFLLGITTSTQILSYSLVVRLNPQKLSGTATSVISIVSLLGGAIIQPLFGMLLADFSVNNVITGHSYSSAIKSLLVAFIISFFISLLLKKEKP